MAELAGVSERVRAAAVPVATLRRETVLTIVHASPMLTNVNITAMLMIVNISAMPNTVNAATIGALVRDTRTAARLTQTELATRIGASRFWVAEFEKGKPSAELGLALKALNALGLAVHIEPKSAAGAPQATPRRAESEHCDLATVIAHTTLTRTAKSSVVGWPTASAPTRRSRKA